MSSVIALDVISQSGAGSDRGLGRYASTLLESLEGHSTNSIVPVRMPPGMRREGPIASTKALRSVAHARPSVYHATAPNHLPIPKHAAWVCSVQDTIPLDLRAYTRLGLRTRAESLWARRSDVLLANSHHTAERVAHYFDRPVEEIPVCPLPVGEAFAQSPPGLNECFSSETVALLTRAPYVVVLGDFRTHDPRKRLHWGIALAHALRPSGIATVLAHRGTAPPSDAYLPLKDLTDSQLAALYAQALAFFYPSAYEGQGMPPLEAMATGCPVIAFRNSSVAEVVGEDDFLVSDPVPWQLQRLDDQMPEDCAQHLAGRVDGWARDPELRLRLSQTAQKRALAWSVNDVARTLDRTYGLALAT